MESRNFPEHCINGVKEGSIIARRYLIKGRIGINDAIKDANELGLSQEIVYRVQNRGMLDGSFEMTYEGAERIIGRIRAKINKASIDEGVDYLSMFDAFDPVIDQDLIATGIFVLIPSIRDYVKNNYDSLYRVVLTAGSNKKRGYSLPVKQKERRNEEHIFSPHLEQLISAIPQTPKSSEEKEAQNRLLVLIDHKAKRELFPSFKQDGEDALTVLEKRIQYESNQRLKEAYQRLHDSYKAYFELKIDDVNPNFIDPTTGELCQLPSLHQRIPIYHIINDLSFGVFNGCGTGKTAVAVLAASLIEQKLGGLDRILIIGPNPSKKTWKRGLAGNDQERYLREKQNIFVVNGERKDLQFMRELEKAKWVVVNYEQLITKMNGSDKLFFEELVSLEFPYVILDESHHIRSQRKQTVNGRPTLSIAAQVLAKRAQFLALMTATPIVDRLSDYGVSAHLILPEKFSSPESLMDTVENNPRLLYTFFHEKTVRMSSEEINEDLEWEEHEELIDLHPVQRQVYDFIVEFRPPGWMIEARKSLTDPRLVDPEILEKAGVLGQVSLETSAKYNRLFEMLSSDDGPVVKEDKFVIFSTMFKEGVTQKGNARLRGKYESLGRLELYNSLGLDKSLDEVICDVLQKRFERQFKIGIIDGTVIDIEERERIVEELSNGLDGIACTTEAGGESLSFVAANWSYVLDEHWSPEPMRQLVGREVRPGQTKKVFIKYLRGRNTLDESLRDYVEKKRIVNKMATDGCYLTREELELLEDSEGKKLGELIKKSLGGISIDVDKAVIESIDDFEVKKRVKRSSGSRNYSGTIDYTTTEAQKIMAWIGKDPINCWKDPEFVELYMKTLNNLAVPVIHRSKICDLLRRARQKQIIFPEIVLSDGSGPSLLYNTYQTLTELVEKSGFKIPIIYDRDTSQPMLDKGSNPNKFLACMTGKDSPFQNEIFDMVDNESISLLTNPEEVKQCLLESHRVLRNRGLLELIVKNKRFSETFYSGIEKLGFELITQKNEGFSASSEMMKRLKKTLGDHFAESYAHKLSDTYLMIARKINNPSEVKADNFWFKTPEEDEDPAKPPTIIVKTTIQENNNGKNIDGKPISPHESRNIIMPRKRGKRR